MAEYARDDFSRTVASGWGTAVLGGAWSEVLTLATSDVKAGRNWGTITTTGTNAGVAYERLAAATAAADVALAMGYRVAISAASTFQFTLAGRVSGAVGDPVCYGARVSVDATTGTILLELVRVAAGGAVTVLAGASYAAGTYTASAHWRVELQLAGPKLLARTYPYTAVPPAGNGWISAGDETITAAGVYGVRLSRTAPASSTTSWAELDDFYASDLPAPDFTATPTGLTVAFSSAPSTGDFTAYSWSWGDGSANGSGASPSHTYPRAGSFLVRLTGTTRWGATYYGEKWVEVSAPPPPPPGPAVLPLVLIGGVDVCDDLVSVDWGTGATHWADGITGQTASVVLRGQYAGLQGQPVAISAPTSPTKRLWVGLVDQVTQDVGLTEPAYTTTVIAMDNASFLARQHLEWATILPRKRLAGRLDDLRPSSRISYRAKWSGINTLRYPELRKMNAPGDKLRGRSYMDMVNEALQASITYAYTARDGAIVYGPLDAPGWSGTVPTTGVIQLSSGIDCAAHVDKDVANLEGIINRWTYGDGDGIDIRQGSSMEAYGEHAYTTPAGVLVDYTFWPIWQPLIAAMDDPAASIEVEVPVTDLAQLAITIEPLDLARLDGVLYAVMGVRHSASFRGDWRTTLTLDRNPWATYGATPP